MARDAYLGSKEITTEPLYDPGNIIIDYCELQHAGGTLNLNPRAFMSIMAYMINLVHVDFLY